MTRILTAAVLLLALWAVVFHAPLPLFFTILGVGLLRAVWEACRLIATAWHPPFTLLALAASAGFVASFATPEPWRWIAMALIAACGLAMLAGLALRPSPSEMVLAATATLLPVLFIGLPLAYGLGLRTLSVEEGRELVLMMFGTVIAADTAAFYVGSLVGKRPLAPRLSPNKTVAGAVGGLAGAVAAAMLIRQGFWPGLALGHAAGLGALLGAAAIVGDLSESALKRAAGAKDTSALLPGHGGLLDRCDSLLFAAPLLYYYYEVFLLSA